jgi:hypothetical protein
VRDGRQPRTGKGRGRGEHAVARCTASSRRPEARTPCGELRHQHARHGLLGGSCLSESPRLPVECTPSPLPLRRRIEMGRFLDRVAGGCTVSALAEAPPVTVHGAVPGRPNDDEVIWLD